ncbi:MAG: AAA family ATPase [Nocardioidaceae bacterium]
MPEKTSVVVAAGGAAWETAALELLAHAGPAVVLLKRCVDLRDLLASASTGLADAAVLSARLPGLDVDSVAALRRSGLGVVLVDDDPDGAERVRRLGVTHVLGATDLDELVDAILLAGVDGPTATGEAAAGDQSPDPAIEPEAAAGRLVAVWGPAGAPGRTTVAVGLATELAALGRPTLLLDADPYAGAVGQHLGVLDEVSGLLAAARSANAGALDPDRLAGYARQVGERLRVLTGLPRADRWAEVRPRAFDDLLEAATRVAGTVVVDTGFSLEQAPADPFEGASPARNGMTLAALERADEVVVVGAADPVGLSRLARGLVELHDRLPGVTPRVVVNRTRASLGWGEKDVRGMVEGFVAPRGVHFLPDDRAATDRALMAGRSLAETGDSGLRRALAEVAAAVTGEPPVPRRSRRRRQELKSR